MATKTMAIDIDKALLLVINRMWVESLATCYYVSAALTEQDVVVAAERAVEQYVKEPRKRAAFVASLLSAVS